MSKPKNTGNTRQIQLPDTYTPDPSQDGNVKEVTGRLRARHLIPIYRKKLELVLADLADKKDKMPPEHYATYEKRRAVEVYVFNCTIQELEALTLIRARSRVKKLDVRRGNLQGGL
jgi:hypothetical protein